MTVEEERRQVARRIVVTLDASACGRAALETAAQLAAELQAELQGLFVEDEDLLRLASLPFASEVALPDAVPRRLKAARIHSVFRTYAEKVRQALSDVAVRRDLRWSFQVLQGDVVRTSRAAAAQAELLIVGWTETAADSSPWIVEGKPRARLGSILAIDDGTSDSDRVLRTAVELAQIKRGRLLVLSLTAGTGEGTQRQRQIAQFLQNSGVEYTVQPLPMIDARTIACLAESVRNKALLLVLRSDLLSESELEILVRRLKCPLALVP